VKIIPVEAYNSIGITEWYHGPVHRAYQIIIVEIRDIDKDIALQIAFKAINDSTGPDRLILILLVFGAYPQMTEFDPPLLITTQRVTIIKKAIAEIQKIQAKRQVANALNTYNRLNTDSVHNLELNI
jgi:hypothetical protein